jgi:hypothetical protein
MNSGQCHNHTKEVAPERGYVLPTLGWSDSLEVLLQCATVRILEKYVVGFILYVAPVESDKVRQRLLVCARVKPPERSRFAFIVLFGIRVYSCVRFKDENILRGRTYLSKCQQSRARLGLTACVTSLLDCPLRSLLYD